MNRKFLLGCLMMSSVAYVSAQSIAFVHEGEQLADGASLEVREGPVFMPNMLVCNLGVKNLTGSPVVLQIWKEEINDFARDPDNISSFCLGVCSNDPYTSEFTVQPGETFNDNGEMHGQFVAGKDGTGIVKYEAFVVDNDEDRVSVVVSYTYNSGQGINDMNQTPDFRVLPSADGVIFDYSGEENGILEITDMTGRAVARVILQAGNREYPVKLDKGVYVYSLCENGSRSQVRKFIVK